MIKAIARRIGGNNTLSQILVTTVAGIALSQARNLTRLAAQAVKDQLVTTLRVSDDYEVFRNLMVLLSRQPDLKRSRRLGVVVSKENDSGKRTHKVGFGLGNHVLHFGNIPIFVHVGTEMVMVGDTDRMRSAEYVTLTVPGKDAAPLEALLKMADTVHDQDNVVMVSSQGNYGRATEFRSKRSLDSIIIDHDIKRSIVNEIDRFTNSKDIYLKRGVPYRHGIMLDGPPGVGKTSLIFGLASHFDRPIHVVNASSTTDSGLHQAFQMAPENAFVVMEDVDTASATIDRDKKGDGKDIIATLTTSGLLNAIDGIAAKEGRVLFLTTNRPEVLDPALLRPGRIDSQYHLGPLDHDLAQEMVDRFLPGTSVDTLPVDLPVVPAELQGTLLSMVGTL